MTLQTAVAARPATHDFYHTVHKGIRLAETRLLVRLGACDAEDPQAVAATLAALEDFLTMARCHLAGEEREIHAVIAAREPGASAHAEADHDDHIASFDAIAVLADAVRAAQDKGAALERLYRRFALFVAHDLEHMEQEQGPLLGALQDCFADAELQAIENRIVGAIAPATMALYMRAILPALRPAERRGMLEGMAAGMPEVAFAALLTATIGRDWRTLDAEARDAAVSGL